MLSLVLALVAYASPLSAASPVSPLPVPTRVCLSCYIPGCPNFSFFVCNGTPGKTTVGGSIGRVKARTGVSDTSTATVGMFGNSMHPASPKTWGTVTSCSDIHGDC